MKTNKIYLADVFDFLNKLEDNSVDLAIVDPPYNMKKGTWDTFKDDESYFEFTFNWIDLLLKKLKKEASLYLLG